MFWGAWTLCHVLHKKMCCNKIKFTVGKQCLEILRKLFFFSIINSKTVLFIKNLMLILVLLGILKLENK